MTGRFPNLYYDALFVRDYGGKYGMLGQRAFAIVATLAAVSCYASETDVELGKQWAKCSTQADIFQTLSKNTEEIERWKKTSAMLHIYAIAAAGKEVVRSERANIKAAFYKGAFEEDVTKRAAYLNAFYAQAQTDLKFCSGSYVQNQTRFKAKVHKILERSKQ